MNSPLLEARRLSKQYRIGPALVDVLAEVEFSLAQGVSAAITGASGSGKSTLLHLLGGLDQASSGQVLLDGEDWQQLSERQRNRVRNRRIGFVYQFHHLLPEFTALENVMLPCVISGLAIGEGRQRAAELLGRVGLGERLQHKPAELSGGERQRAAIARALVNRPGLVLADEPTGNLDRHSAERVMDLLLELQREMAVSVLLVTHDMNLAAALDQTWKLDDGRLHCL